MCVLQRFWFLEVVASYVSMTNRCDYSLTHHWANARRLMQDPARAQQVRDALEAAQPEQAFSGKELAFLNYARKLSSGPSREPSGANLSTHLSATTALLTRSCS